MSNLSMHFDALPITFKRAKELRAFMTAPEKILWEYLNNNQLGL
jgi:very-short-patch-repair endonuclease